MESGTWRCILPAAHLGEPLVSFDRDFRKLVVAVYAARCGRFGRHALMKTFRRASARASEPAAHRADRRMKNHRTGCTHDAACELSGESPHPQAARGRPFQAQDGGRDEKEPGSSAPPVCRCTLALRPAPTIWGRWRVWCRSRCRDNEVRNMAMSIESTKHTAPDLWERLAPVPAVIRSSASARSASRC
jgi:hypothetical protein